MTKNRTTTMLVMMPIGMRKQIRSEAKNPRNYAVVVNGKRCMTISRFIRILFLEWQHKPERAKIVALQTNLNRKNA